MIYSNVRTLTISLYNNETGQTCFCSDIGVDYYSGEGHYICTDLTEIIKKITDKHNQDYDFDLIQVFYKENQDCPIEEEFIYYMEDVKGTLKRVLDKALDFLDETYGEDSYA